MNNQNLPTILKVTISRASERRSTKIPMANVYYNGNPIFSVPISNVAHILGGELPSAKAGGFLVR